MSVAIRNIGCATEIDRLLNKIFVFSSRTGYVEVGEDNFCLPIYYQNYAERIKKFQVRTDDVFITGHPKSGTTWMNEMTWLLVNNLDYEGAKQYMYERCPQLEFAALFDLSVSGIDQHDDFHSDPFAHIEKLKGRRCIKTHLHWSLLPEQIQNGTKEPKIIVVLRNPQDCCVSLYYHSKVIDGFQGTFEEFCKLFLAGRVAFGPFWKNVQSYWRERHRSNLIFIRYREMKEDLPGVLRKLSSFLGKSYSDEQMENLSKHLSFESMKANPAVNMENVFEKLRKSDWPSDNFKFIRSGKVGGYKSAMSPEVIQQFYAWTAENSKGTNILVD